jgi:hypothetical protein
MSGASFKLSCSLFGMIPAVDSTAGILQTDSTAGILQADSTAGILQADSSAGILQAYSTAGILQVDSTDGIIQTVSICHALISSSLKSVYFCSFLVMVL